jgi:uridine phosphorylase
MAKKKSIQDSELILNEDGSVYHLKLLPEDIAHTIITVGDPERVKEISKYFDIIVIKKSNREFVTHTGFIGKLKLTVIATGIGTDNIDIVLNELDALVNIDLKTKTILPKLTQLKIIRIGTSGTMNKEIAVDSVVASAQAVGLDSLGQFYKLKQNAASIEISKLILKKLKLANYCVAANKQLISQFKELAILGTTITCPGFYAPQGRQLRYQLVYPNLLNDLIGLNKNKIIPITNFEMETAGIYALGNVLGHHCISLSLIVANRKTFEFSKDYHKHMDTLIQNVLKTITTSAFFKV